jgi:hypothetical protein
MYFLNFPYPLRCLRVSPGVLAPRVEYHCSSWPLGKLPVLLLKFLAVPMMITLTFPYILTAFLTKYTAKGPFSLEVYKWNQMALSLQFVLYGNGRNKPTTRRWQIEGLRDKSSHGGDMKLMSSGHPSTLKMVAARPSYTFIRIYHTTRSHIPQDTNLHRGAYILHYVGELQKLWKQMRGLLVC